jgi:hypothetical protein
MSPDEDRLVLGPNELAALGELQQVQEQFDDANWKSSSDPLAKRRHIGFHLTIAAGKLARIEERLDHGQHDTGTISDVAADLLVYALQLASLTSQDLGELYQRRLSALLSCTGNHDAFVYRSLINPAPNE